MYTYENYLGERDSITMEKAAEIYARICSAVDPENEDDREILGDFLKAAAKYAGIRAGWNLLSREEKMETDANRTACHNGVILHLNILARYLASKGKNTSWREELGDEKEHRKKIGDFACYVTCIEGLNAR